MKKRHRVGARRWWRRINAPLVAAAVATALAALVYAGDRKSWWTVPGMEELELASVDMRFRVRGAVEPQSQAIVVIGVDDRTHRDYPEVFQTRRGWARLITALGKTEPRAIGLDLFFANPEVALDPDVVAQVREAATNFHAEVAPKTTGGEAALAALDAVIEQTRGDELLARAVAGAKQVHLGVLFFLPEGGEPGAAVGAPEPPGLALARYGEAVAVAAPRSRRPAQARAVQGSLPSISEGAVGAGALNVYHDLDGGVRRVPLVLEYGGRFYMPMGLSMALANLGSDSSFVVGDDFVGVGERQVPVDPQGVAQLAFLGPNKTFHRVSAADVLSGNLAPGALKDKVLLVGFTDSARDKVRTPFDTQLDGVEVHATLAHNIIHGELLELSSPTTTLLTILGFGLLLTVLQLRRIRQQRSWIGGLSAITLITFYLIAAQRFFADGLVLELAAPLGASIFVSAVALTTALATEGRDKRQLRAAFEQYVSETLVDRIVKDIERAELKLGGERRDLTVLFSDIRGFSRFSEQLEPEVLSEYLNEYLTPMSEVVIEQDGLLDKYIGDAIMSVYGAPLEMTDHAQRGCRAALAMQERLQPLNTSWRERGLPEIAIGVGLNTGPMSVGNMGSDMLFDYTVMGDAVNLAARLEALTKEYGVGILTGEETARLASDEFVFREVDLVRVMGRDATARVFELVGARGSARMSEDDLSVWNQALSAYRDRDWDRAEAGFSEFVARFPADGPAHVLRDRVRTLRRNPPDDDWNGVYAQVSK